MRRARALRAVTALALAVTGMVGASPAAASKEQLSLFQDDAQLVLSGDAAREQGLNDLGKLGVDAVHSIVFWGKVAPKPAARTRPAGFDGSDPAAYGAAAWDKYDELVKGAQARGLQVVLSPAGPIPLWASGCKPAKGVALRTCRPSPTQYKRFVQALGVRYSGSFADENGGGGVLPRVERWSVWNEPNQGGWLTPQYARVRGRAQPQSPVIYRALVRAAAKGLAASGHRSDELLFGETAPLGRRTGALAKRPIAPGAFLRAALCLDARGRSARGATARALDCAGFRRLPVTGISHHPYTRGGSRAPTARGGSTEITIASASRLKVIIRQAAAHHRIRSGLRISYTEFGFQTNPPDELFGVGLDAQAAYLNHSDWIAYRDPGVRTVAQYELRDEQRSSGFQTGLRFIDGQPKPGYAAYRMPLWLSKQGGRVRVWGQVRPAADGAREQIEVQNAAKGSEAFETVATAATQGAKGFVDVTVAPRAGSWRLRWAPADGSEAMTSRVAAGVGR